MSDLDDDFSKYGVEVEDELRPIEIAVPGGVPLPKLDDLPPELADQDPAAPKRKLKKLADGTIVPEEIGDFVYDQDLNRIYKGDYMELTKLVPSLRQIYVAAGWEQRSIQEARIDIDLSLFLLDKNEQTRVDSDFIFYNNDSASEGAVKHLGDNRTGAGEGDNETVLLDLNGVPFDVWKIMVVLSIYDEDQLGFDFSTARNIFVRLVNKEDGLEIARMIVPDEDVANYNTLLAVTIVREGPKWYLEAPQQASKGGLSKIAQGYGIIVAEQTG